MGSRIRSLLSLVKAGADPATAADGDLWHRYDMAVLRGRWSGANHTLAGLDDLPVPGGISPRAGMWGIAPAIGQTSNMGLTASRIYYLPCPIARPWSCDQIAVSVVTATASSTIYLGLYSDSNGPNVLLTQWGSIATTATGHRALAISQSFTPGMYWVALQTSAAVANIQALIGTDPHVGIISAAPTTAGAGYYQSGAFTVGTLPTSATLTGTLETVPRVTLHSF